MKLYREAFFKAGDLHNPKDFQTTLNRTFGIGTLLCHFKQTELLQLVTHLSLEARRRTEAVTFRRRMVANAGRQEGTPLIFLSPTQILDLTTGSLVKHYPHHAHKAFGYIYFIYSSRSLPFHPYLIGISNSDIFDFFKRYNHCFRFIPWTAHLYG